MSNLWPLHLQAEAQRANVWPSRAVVGLSSAADGFARGVEDGRRTVEAELAAEREALLLLVTSLEALAAPPAGVLAALIVAAVERLVIDIAGNAPTDARLLMDRADALAVFMTTESETVIVCNPDDAPLFDAERLDMRIISDPALPRGTVQARANGAVAEDGVGPALSRLHDAIDCMGLAS